MSGNLLYVSSVEEFMRKEGEKDPGPFFTVCLDQKDRILRIGSFFVIDRQPFQVEDHGWAVGIDRIENGQSVRKVIDLRDYGIGENCTEKFQRIFYDIFLVEIVEMVRKNDVNNFLKKIGAKEE